MTFISCAPSPQAIAILDALREAVANRRGRGKRQWCLPPVDLGLKAIPGQAAPYELQPGELW